jgi:hypothetical protein
MAEPNESTQIDAAELATLRTTNAELLQKNAARKKRVEELTASLAEREGQLAEATASLRKITIDAPLLQMAESLSTAPDLWMEQLQKLYRIEHKDGALTLLTQDGKPVQREGKDVPFERKALLDFLTNEKHPQSTTFRAITVKSHASGGAQTEPVQRRVTATQKPAVKFGLR